MLFIEAHCVFASGYQAQNVFVSIMFYYKGFNNTLHFPWQRYSDPLFLTYVNTSSYLILLIINVALQAAAARHYAIVTQIIAVGMNSSSEGQAVYVSPECTAKAQTNAHFLWHTLWEKKTGITWDQHSLVFEKCVMTSIHCIYSCT